MADVLVVGAGLAGLAAAIEAAQAGADVAVVAAGGGASHLAQGGLAAAVGPGDSPRRHAEDTLAAGAGASDPEAVDSVVGAGPETVRWLEAQGVAFEPGLSLEAAHSLARVLHRGDRTGTAIMRALEVRAAELRIRRVEGRLEGLLVGGQGCAGAMVSGAAGGRIEAAATVLATGGYAALWARTVAAPPARGDGLLAALAAGADLADLEFVQFHPTAFAGPGPAFLLTEALRGAGAIVVDGAGRRFLFDADLRGELAPRSAVAQAIAARLARAGTRVYLDARPIGAQVLESEFAGFLAACRARGLEPLREPVPIAPAAHYTMGGIVTDLEGGTAVPGLFAAGECARIGLHGANRLASNSLLEAAVMGRRAGRAAALAPVPVGGPVRLAAPGPALAAARAAELMSRCAGIVRTRAGLEAALSQLPAGCLQRLVVEAALMREESRGAHQRADHPDPDPLWEQRELRVSIQEAGPAWRTCDRRVAVAA